jgi:Family of unknown function (DUF5320)
MPRYDRTGPTGAGPGTGFGRGFCMQGSRSSGYAGPGRGGMFRGRGFGFRSWWQGFRGRPTASVTEAEALRASLSEAKEEIAAMEARLAELEQKE